MVSWDFMVVLWDLYGIYPLVSSNMVVENPLHMEVLLGKSLISMVHFPARHV